MAAGRNRPHQIPALKPSRENQMSPPRRYHQNALAHRARLSGAQTGNRARPLRGPRLARLSSSRHTVHRGLRLPDLPTGEDSPLSTTCAIRSLIVGTPKILSPPFFFGTETPRTGGGK